MTGWGRGTAGLSSWGCAAFRDTELRIGFIAVLRDVQPDHLGFSGHTQANHGLDGVEHQ